MQVGVLAFSAGGKEGVRATYKITNRSRAALRRLEVRSMRRDEAGGQPGPNLTYQRCISNSRFEFVYPPWHFPRLLNRVQQFPFRVWSPTLGTFSAP